METYTKEEVLQILEDAMSDYDQYGLGNYNETYQNLHEWFNSYNLIK